MLLKLEYLIKGEAWMKIKDKEIVIKATAGNVRIKRMKGGFPRIQAEKEIDLHYGLGYIHGHDRQMHHDRYSLQAEVFMSIIEPLLPSTENGDILKSWDRRYDTASLGASLFESVYLELIKLVFGENGMGMEIVTPWDCRIG
jgi:acyl-homoserine lactone acylase PvdQ